MRTFVFDSILCFPKKKNYSKICHDLYLSKSKLSSYKNIRYAQYDNELMLAISLFLISKCLCLCVSHAI